MADTGKARISAMSAADQVTIMSSRMAGGGPSTSAARVILQNSGPVSYTHLTLPTKA